MNAGRAFVTLAWAAWACQAAVAADTASTLRLLEPTIVIWVGTEAEQQQRQRDSRFGEFSEFSSDFNEYANRLARAMQPHGAVNVRWSDADTVSFPGTSFAPLHRHELETQSGVVLFRPGQAPYVHAGVPDDNVLVCVAEQLYRIQVQGYRCAPQAVDATPTAAAH